MLVLIIAESDVCVYRPTSTICSPHALHSQQLLHSHSFSASSSVHLLQKHRCGRCYKNMNHLGDSNMNLFKPTTGTTDLIFIEKYGSTHFSLGD